MNKNLLDDKLLEDIDEFVNGAYYRDMHIVKLAIKACIAWLIATKGYKIKIKYEQKSKV